MSTITVFGLLYVVGVYVVLYVVYVAFTFYFKCYVAFTFYFTLLRFVYVLYKRRLLISRMPKCSLHYLLGITDR